jgi:hypothetical protein
MDGMERGKKGKRESVGTSKPQSPNSREAPNSKEPMYSTLSPKGRAFSGTPNSATETVVLPISVRVLADSKTIMRGFSHGNGK